VTRALAITYQDDLVQSDRPILATQLYQSRWNEELCKLKMKDLK
jgi:hypothetical protein